MQTLISKAEFAKRKQRSPACVTKWLKTGKIGCNALIGEGPGAKIWVERADADLAASLQPGHQASRQFPANERSSVAQLEVFPPAAGVTTDAPIAVSDLELDRARRAKADANKAEYDAETVRRRLDLDNGKYVDAMAASAQMAKMVTRTITIIEAAIPDLSTAIAGRFSLSQRDVLHELRKGFRGIRARAAGKARNEAATLPALVADDVLEDGPEHSVQGEVAATIP